MTEACISATMESYLMMLYVTLEQESALKNFFVDHGWTFCKPDLTVTTDRLGPAVRDVQAESVPSESDINPRLLGKRKVRQKQNKAPVIKLAKIIPAPSSSETNVQTFDNVQADSDVSEQLDDEPNEAELQDIGDIEGSSNVDPKIKAETLDSSFNEDYDDDNEDDNDDDVDTDVDDSYEEAKEGGEMEADVTERDEAEDETGVTEEAVRTKASKPKIKQGKQYQCEICDAEYSRKYRLSQHIRRVHMGLISSHPCMYCDASFNTKSSKNRHESIIHLGVLKHICEECGKTFANIRLLDGHKRSVHFPETKFKCDLCGKPFAFVYNLQAHTRICSKKNCKMCNVCKENFMSVEALDSHLFTKHNVNRKIVCEKCDKTFSSKKCLQSHLKFKHGNHSDYVCEECGEKYQYPASLLNHKKRHGHYGAKEPGEI